MGFHEFIASKQEDLDQETYTAFKQALPELDPKELVLIIKKASAGIIENDEKHWSLWDHLSLKEVHAASWLNDEYLLEKEFKDSWENPND